MRQSITRHRGRDIHQRVEDGPSLRVVIDDYLRRSGVDIKPDHEVDHLAMAVSLVASTRGVALLPAYAQNLLPRIRDQPPLAGDVPTIDLVVGYSKTNTSPILKPFLSKIDDLIARVSRRPIEIRACPAHREVTRRCR